MVSDHLSGVRSAERRVFPDAVVHDEHVQRAQARLRLRHHALPRRRIGDVRAQGRGLAARPVDLGHGGLGAPASRA